MQEVLEYASDYIQVVDVGTQYEYPCTDQVRHFIYLLFQIYPGCGEIAINMKDEFEVVKRSVNNTVELTITIIVTKYCNDNNSNTNRLIVSIIRLMQITVILYVIVINQN